MNKKLLLYILFALLPLCFLHSQEIKVISFSMCNSMNNRNAGVLSWKGRCMAVKKMFIEESPQIFCVQDALFDQVSYLDRNLSFHYRRVGLSSQNEATRGTYNAIYYDNTKMDLLSYGTLWLSKTPKHVSMGWDAKNYRTVTYAKLKVKGSNDTILCVNTELGRAKEARRESVKLILNIIQRVSSPTMRVIFCGDFKADINDPVVSMITRSGLLSSRETASRTDHKYTYNGYGKAEPAIVDHFFTRNIQALRYKTITKNYGRPYISDHYPIAIVFRLIKKN